MPEPPFDVAKAHRWFAIELNNLAWDFVERPARTPKESERMIHAAHASVHHWREVGAPINLLRGECLLATVYAAAGLGEAALRHAERCAAYERAAIDGKNSFDTATSHGCRATALVLASRLDEAQAAYAQAISVALDADEQEVFQRLYPPPYL